MKTIYIVFFTLFSFALFAQPPVETQIFSENIGAPGDTTILVNFYNGFQNEPPLIISGFAQVESSQASSGYPGASGDGNVFFDSVGIKFLRIANINTQNYIFLELSFGIYKSTVDSDGSELVLEYSQDGINFLPLNVPALPTGDGTDTWHHVTVNLPFFAQNLENLVLNWRRITPATDSTLYRLDDISLIGDYYIPVISPSDDSLSLPPVALGEYDSIEYSVSATYLIQDVEIISENPSFEIYDPVDSVWGSSLTLLKDSLSPMDSVTVLVRHRPLEAVGDETGVFRHSTFGGQDTIVEVFGTAITTEPLIVTPAFSATANASGLIHLQWAPGDGGRRVIIARQGSAVNFVPTDGVPPLSANEDFSLAPEINGNKFVFDTDSTFIQATIYGLNPATTYHFAIFEYNVGTGNSQNYLTDSSAVAQALTPFSPPGLQVTEPSTAYLINFQETVPGVLNGAYNGSGLSPANVPGRLNTSAWRVSLNPGPNGSTQYNSPATSNPNFGKGPSTGGSATNGIYAFQTEEGNIALGVKPFVQNNNNVFSTSPGGFFELRSQNKTNQAVEEAYVSFVYYVYNNGNLSTDFKLSYSVNGNIFTDLTDFDFETPAALDNPVGWKKHVYSVKISGLSIPLDGFLYIRWTGEDTGGVGTRDAFAIDDISIAMDPDANFEGGVFSGTVHSGILAANIRLNGASNIVDSLILQDSAVLFTGVHNLTLGANVTINEDDGYIKGNLLVSRVIVANVAQTFGGIGLSITTPVAAGLTNVKRVTGVFEGSGDNLSIARWFEIVPTNNVNLNATMAFTFKDFESPNFTPTQANFRLFRRAIGSYDPWVAMAVGTLSGTTYTVSGIANFNAEITGGDIFNAPLPLDWLSFDVIHDKGFNLIKWVTANEVNTSAFEIEKSYDGKNFVSIATEQARGGNLTETYQYTDKHDRSGLIYYRIKQIDWDQKYSYSPLRSVRADIDQKMRVYPTAVSEYTTVYSDREMEAQVSIVNAQGAIVKKFELLISKGDQVISVNDLVSGVYWIKIENNEINESFRIVKQ
ncbi:MAG: T9SS type A sorting domain-containing protein [Saprospiraceae bacterium]|nr:T9SS type A sorting domain-containing protein [Saprospiraceae bacterium]